MISDKFRRQFLLKALLITALVATAVLSIIFHHYYYLVPAVALLIYLWINFYQYQVKAHEEVEQFNESVRYHDFSRHFNEGRSGGEWRTMRKSFNEVFTVIKGISKEKEKHYQYLHKILELVDTGIVSFETTTHEVVWINESISR
jgi:two-component system nitrogen regulation sensor histidine kinase NtrY